MIPKENEIGRVFTCDEWEYRFTKCKDIDLDDMFNSDDLLEEISNLNHEELLAFKELLRILPASKKEPLSPNSKPDIVLQTYLGEDTEVICPESIEGYPVVRLSSNVFLKCKDTPIKLIIPSSVQYISKEIFKSCVKLETIEIMDYSEYYEFKDGCLYEKKTGAIIFCSRKKEMVTIQGDVREIGMYTFSDCNRLSEVNIAANDITLPKDLFIGCNKLKKLRLPNSFAAFNQISGELYKKYFGIACTVDLTRCNELSDVFFDGTWEQWLQKPVCVLGKVTIHLKDGSTHNDRRYDDLYSDLMAKLHQTVLEELKPKD